MKTKWIMTVVAALVMGVSATVQAVPFSPLNGNISFTGGVQLNTGAVGTATGVSAWSTPSVESNDGDFSAFVSNGQAVTIAAPWSFNSGALANFWQVGGFTFDLTSSSVTFQNANIVAVEGSGVVSGNGFGPSQGSWYFSANNPGTGSPATFSFSAGTSVPDGGTTMMLLGGSLVGVGFLRRKLLAV